MPETRLLGMFVLLIIALAGLFLYILKTQQWLRAWQKLPEFEPLSFEYLPLTVVIAFRNESPSIPNLLHDLMRQDYPADLFDVILVDDYSNDDSVEQVRKIAEGSQNIKCLSNTNKPGKKGALITGIEASSHELIITTDADVRLSELWLALMSSFYSRYRPSMIIGLVDVINDRTSILNRFFAVEQLSLIASGAGAAAQGKPIFCNGANLAFSKLEFLKHKEGLEMQTVSGDDTFLLHVMKSKHKKIELLRSFGSVVEVRVPETLRDFIRQRIRWASKSRYYRDMDTLFTAFLVFVVNSSVVVSAFLLIAARNYWLFGLLLVGKGIADYRLISNFYKYLKKPFSLYDYLLLLPLYPFYVTATAIAGFFAGYTWKGRKY